MLSTRLQSSIWGVPIVVNVPSFTDVYPGLTSLLLLASPAVPLVSCAAVRLAVNVFLQLLFRPWSPSYAAFPTAVPKLVYEI
jgi:hypothetical protein